MAIHRSIAACSSVALRGVAYLFLRWFPGPAPVPLSVFALFAVYVPSFVYSYLNETGYKVIDDRIDVTVVKPAPVLANDTSRPNRSNGTPKSNRSNGTSKSNRANAAPVLAEKVDIEETITLAPKSAQFWRTLLTGAPSPTSTLLSLLTFALNLALVLMTADQLFSARNLHPSHDLSFARLGHVSHTTATFVLREPDQARLPVTLELRVRDPRPPFDAPTWHAAGSVGSTGNDSDFTAPLEVALRHPRQREYEWRTSNGHSGSFLAPPAPGAAPEYHGGVFTFLSTSCILPRFPYSPFEHPLAVPGLRHLARLIPSLKPYFMLFLGDFLYIDIPKRDGVAPEDYAMKYRQVYASPDWLPVAQNLSWIHVLDDHEIANDWDANTTGVYAAAAAPWHHYHASANPPRARAVLGSTPQSNPVLGEPRTNATWFEFAHGPASFFLLDTRSRRSANTVRPYDAPGKTMLGEEQLADLLAWLARPEPQGVRWKIVASSVPFTKNWPVNRRDTWGGFLAERARVMEGMWDAAARGYGVVVLSGDRHEFAATRFPPPAGGRWDADKGGVYEFSVSPLNQFASPIGTYTQTDDEDVLIKYIPAGNSKFGAITIENFAKGEQSSLKYRLFIDGEEKWSTLILAPPIPESERSPASFWDRITG